ncbi:glycosyltransferase family 2 protein [Hoeflea prorocentri]|uniref:Glycosyltransferase n=1 Tax=Hoeflea prorocentri TaxID=1922333 RepID=A0A9X3UHW1_9HYPH|nr:glycosyltransferase [Hoeflea prorocentri]MCY6380962.1 glycosyltransferase [Hoeflea prorocentri]MDA5398762.1 glycosyltransferase [Hoeflea prorocentri]
MPITVVIPSIPFHVQYLPSLLRAFASGETVPNELIVSLSNADQVWRPTVNALERLGKELFPSFHLLRHVKTLKHGPNRQAAVAHCTNDIISFFDSDDLPYPNRIKVLEEVFKDEAVSHVSHGCTSLGSPLFCHWPDTIPIRAKTDDLLRLHFSNGQQSISDCTGSVYCAGLPQSRYSNQYIGIHSGHVTVRKNVFEKVQWKDWGELCFGSAEDFEFDIECLFHYRQSIVIDLPLSQYRKGHKPANRVSRLIRSTGRALIRRANNFV